MQSTCLKMRNISKYFPGVRALYDVDFEVNKGEVVALLGENGAGKSTLVNILGGLIRADEGEISLHGNPVNIKSPSDALALGIAFIQQEISLLNQLSIYENMYIDQLVVNKKFKFILDKATMRENADEMLSKLGIDLDINQPVGNLSVSHQQVVEIASALLKDVDIVILDEPATSLANYERERLYEMVGNLRKENRAVVYITHDLDVALRIADRAVVLRDGKNAGEDYCSKLDRDQIIRMMIGRRSGKSFYKTYNEIAEDVVLEASNICTQNKLKDVNLVLNRGEILGLYGLVGSGRTELVHALYGLDKTTTGAVRVMGKNLAKRTPSILKMHGVGYLTENRRDEGLFLTLGIDQNITITDFAKIVKKPLSHIDKHRLLSITNDMIDKLKIRTPSPFQEVGKLSGGNQQKVIVGKWLHLEPKILILDEPTKGIDVGAKEEIYKLINELSSSGISILLISSEIEEVMGLSDRIQVMYNGSLSESMDAKAVNEETIMRLTMGGNNDKNANVL